MRNTPNYNLPQYEGTDKFTKEVLNDAFGKLDTAISDLQETFNITSTGGTLTTQEVVNARNGKQNLKERIDEIDEQYKDIVTNDIPQITEKLDNNVKLVDMDFGSSNRCAVAFVTDDGQLDDYNIWFKQIFEPENVPANNCLVTGSIGVGQFMSWEQAKELKSNGWTVCSHSNTHINITGKTEDEIDNDLRISRDLLLKNGLDHDFYISPYGGYNPSVDRVTRKYFRANWSLGYRFYDGATNINGKDKTNFKNNYNLPRRNGIGEVYEGYETTKQDMKNDIDYAFNNNLPLVFIMHSHYEVFKTGNGIADLREVIQYCKSKKIPIVNLREIDRLYSNKIDLGNVDEDYNLTKIDYKGNIVTTNDILVSADTDVTNRNNYLKIATISNYDGYVDTIVKFKYSISNPSDTSSVSGDVEISIRTNGNMSTTEPYVRILNKVNDNTNIQAPEFTLVLLNKERFNQTFGVYAKLKKNYCRLLVTDFRSISSNSKLSYAGLEKKETFIPQLPTGSVFNQILTNGVYKYDKVPDFTPVFVGQTLVNTLTKKAYIACGSNVSDFIEITSTGGGTSEEEGNFTPVLYGDITDGSVTYTEQIGNYIKNGNLITLNIRLKGVIGSDIDGDIKIKGLPYASKYDASCNVGNSSFSISNGFVVTNAFILSGSKVINIGYPVADGSTGYLSSTTIKNSSIATKNFRIWISATFRVN